MTNWLESIAAWAICPANLPVIPGQLPNNEFYAEIDRKMDALAQPTVEDALNAMLDQGNLPYLKTNWRGENERSHLFRRRGLKKTFTRNPLEHDIPHITGRIGHTPQQEQYVLPMMLGLSCGLDIAGLNVAYDPPEFHDFGEEVKTYFDFLKASLMRDFISSGLRYQRKLPDAPSKADWAIYFAAGLYLRTKIDRFKQAGMLDVSYEEQRTFCNAHADTDEPLIPSREWDYHADDILHAPYALIKLSPREWQSIVAVATGLREPTDTPYPQRLTAVKETLEYTRLQLDLKSRFVDKENVKPRFTDLAIKDFSHRQPQR